MAGPAAVALGDRLDDAAGPRDRAKIRSALASRSAWCVKEAALSPAHGPGRQRAQIEVGESLAIARSLGYRRMTGWLKAVLPRVYPQIRLPIYAVIAYSLSVVDMALLLAPATPPPLAPLLLRWFNDPDFAMRFCAAAAPSCNF